MFTAARSWRVFHYCAPAIFILMMSSQAFAIRALTPAAPPPAWYENLQTGDRVTVNGTRYVVSRSDPHGVPTMWKENEYNNGTYQNSFDDLDAKHSTNPAGFAVTNVTH